MAKSIMIQGTMSGAGKSLLTAALCRIFAQDGYSCAPFKSQNMALNSFITHEGLEMGRAQAMQAEAAGIKPSALMNPILLKPTTDTGSQVIVNGRPVGNMRAREYFKYKKQLVPHIMSAYEQLSKQYDIIVIEGAGSPAELNLKTDDIVNMGMAKLAKAPVLLAGDIDRGGIFPQLLGTLMLLEEDERSMVKGLIVNKFRGDSSLFDDGVRILEERGGVPVAGVVPYVKCELDDEDSLSEKLSPKKGDVNICVIRLPKISNFTDFDVFSQYEGAAVSYVTKPCELENADMVIIPGTKATVADMKWMRESGMEAVVKKCADRGIPVFGICGGYQMMGRRISDPLGAECGGEIRGMELFDGETVFSKQKQRRQTKGVFGEVTGIFSGLSGKAYEGYEIHMGSTVSSEKRFTADGGQRGNLYGSYVHGLFDAEGVAEAIVKALYAKKGLSFTGKGISREKFKQQQYDILADAVRSALDMTLIYRILENGIGKES